MSKCNLDRNNKQGVITSYPLGQDASEENYLATVRPVPLWHPLYKNAEHIEYSISSNPSVCLNLPIQHSKITALPYRYLSQAKSLHLLAADYVYLSIGLMPRVPSSELIKTCQIYVGAKHRY